MYSIYEELLDQDIQYGVNQEMYYEDEINQIDTEIQTLSNTFYSLAPFSWFLQNALIHGILNSWFQTLQATINGTIEFRWIFIFVV